MKKKMQKGFLVALLLELTTTPLLAGPNPPEPQKIDPANGCGQTLSVAGEYALIGDLVCPDTGADFDGIIITASNVILHLAGHTISSTVCDLSRNIHGIFVQGGISGVRIDGGTVSGFNDGVVLSSSGSDVIGMTVKSACEVGILGQGENNQIERNVVTTSGDGVALVPARNTHVAANDLHGNVRAGVAISDFAASNIVESNILNNNGGSGQGYGVAVFNGHGNTIRNNVMNGNDFGVRIGIAAKPDGTPGLGNVVRENTVNGNTQIGIWLEKVVSGSNTGAPSTVRRNTVLNNGTGDGNTADMLDENARCDGNLWKNNIFETDLVDGVPDGGPGAGCI